MHKLVVLDSESPEATLLAAQLNSWINYPPYVNALKMQPIENGNIWQHTNCVEFFLEEGILKKSDMENYLQCGFYGTLADFYNRVGRVGIALDNTTPAIETKEKIICDGKLELIDGFQKIRALLVTGEWEEFKFNNNQANIVEALSKAEGYMLKVDKIRQAINSTSGSNYRVRQSFQNHPNWKRLIVTGKTGKGYWKLNI